MSEGEGVQVSDDSQVLEIDQAQLEQLLNVGGGEAEFIDQHGNRIRLTAEELLDVGFAAESMTTGNVMEISTEQSFGDKRNTGEYYIINQGVRGSSSGMNLPPPVICQDLPEAVAETVVVTMDAAESETDRPPILSASIPLRNGVPVGSGDPAAYQDAKQLSDLLEEYRKELQEKEGQLRVLIEKQKQMEKVATEIAHSLVKNVEWGEAEIYVGTIDAPENLSATVYVKRSRQHEPTPDDAIMIQLESGETCYVTTEDFTNHYLAVQAAAEVDCRAGLHCCDRCPRRFNLESDLKRHLEVGHPPRFRLFCEHCNKHLLLANEAALQAHFRLFHAKKRTTRRKYDREVDGEEREPHWELISTDRSGDSVPENNRIQGGEHQCSVCLNIFPTAFSGRKHLKEEHNISDEQISRTLLKPFAEETVHLGCNLCSKTFSRKEYLKKHRLAHKDRISYACKFCPCRYKWKENLQRHLNAHGNQANFKCPDCRLIFFNQTRLDVHYKSRHPGRSRDQICPLCERTFHEKESLAKHMRGHSKEPVKCGECYKKFADTSFLAAHMAFHTGIRRYTCQVCDKVFSKVEYLAAHSKTHKEKKIACDVCGMKFADRSMLRIHGRCHSKLYPFACSTCCMHFMCVTELREHNKKHRTRKMYGCSLCRKTFSTMDSLKLHVASHNQIRPFPCTKCDNAFYDQTALKRHMLLHGRGKPYKCAVCKKGFDKMAALKNHLQTHMDVDDAPYIMLTAKAGIADKVRFVYRKKTKSKGGSKQQLLSATENEEETAVTSSTEVAADDDPSSTQQTEVFEPRRRASKRARRC